MAIFDVDTLLRPIPGDSPCGEAMDYDLDFLELETAARRRPAAEPDQPSEAPDWADVLKLGTDLATRSMDLRIGLILARAGAGLEGFSGFRHGVDLIAGYVERFWTQVHPNPDEGDDETVRLNALANLSDPDELLFELRQIPVAQSRRLGTYSFAGRLDGEAGAPDETAAAFRDTDPTALIASSQALAAILDALGRVEAVLRERFGAGETTQLDPVLRLLRQIKAWVDEHAPVIPTAITADAAEDAAPAQAVGVGGAIRDRGDVIALLNQICRWYGQNEPASPVPVLLERVSRLVSQDFLSLLAELAPGGLDQFRFLAGHGQKADS